MCSGTSAPLVLAEREAALVRRLERLRCVVERRQPGGTQHLPVVGADPPDLDHPSIVSDRVKGIEHGPYDRTRSATGPGHRADPPA
jgi:hypothetical protein